MRSGARFAGIHRRTQPRPRDRLAEGRHEGDRRRRLSLGPHRRPRRLGGRLGRTVRRRAAGHRRCLQHADQSARQAFAHDHALRSFQRWPPVRMRLPADSAGRQHGVGPRPRAGPDQPRRQAGRDGRHAQARDRPQAAPAGAGAQPRARPAHGPIEPHPPHRGRGAGAGMGRAGSRRGGLPGNRRRPHVDGQQRLRQRHRRCDPGRRRGPAGAAPGRRAAGPAGRRPVRRGPSELRRGGGAAGRDGPARGGALGPVPRLRPARCMRRCRSAGWSFRRPSWARPS